MLELTFICLDDWSRPVYKDQNDKLWIDVNFGKGKPDLYSSSNNELDGEPDYPIREEHQLLNKYKENPNRFNYMMLDRLRSNCDYYLGHGRRSKNCISGDNGIDTIAEMKRLWNSFPADSKPEWLSMEDIEEYEQEMITPSGNYNNPFDWVEYRRSKKNKQRRQE